MLTCQGAAWRAMSGHLPSRVTCFKFTEKRGDVSLTPRESFSQMEFIGLLPSVTESALSPKEVKRETTATAPIITQNHKTRPVDQLVVVHNTEVSVKDYLKVPLNSYTHTHLKDKQTAF